MKHGFELAAITNNQTFYDYLYRVKKLAIARFKWINLPDSWRPGFLENMLYYYGMCGVLWDFQYGTMLSRVAPYGGLNVYDFPTKCQCYNRAIDDTNFRIRDVYIGTDENQWGQRDKSVVLVQNNYDLIPTYATIQLFCKRLYEIERTMDVNLKLQKTPGLIVCTPKQRLALLNAYQQYDGNEPIIFADKNLLGDASLIKTVDTEAPYLLDKFQTQKQAIFSELLTFLGINTINFEKKERLIESETNSNNQLIKLNVDEEINCRKYACNQINFYFGLNIDVEINYNISQEVENVSKMVENVDEGSETG